MAILKRIPKAQGGMNTSVLARNTNANVKDETGLSNGQYRRLYRFAKDNVRAQNPGLSRRDARMAARNLVQDKQVAGANYFNENATKNSYEIPDAVRRTYGQMSNAEAKAGSGLRGSAYRDALRAGKDALMYQGFNRRDARMATRNILVNDNQNKINASTQPEAPETSTQTTTQKHEPWRINFDFYSYEPQWTTSVYSGPDRNDQKYKDSLNAVTKYNSRWGSNSIKEIQRKLGFTGDAVDGIFGPNTYDKLVDYQRINGLTVDGKIGSQTLGSLGLNASSNIGDYIGGPIKINTDFSDIIGWKDNATKDKKTTPTPTADATGAAGGGAVTQKPSPGYRWTSNGTDYGISD